MANKKCFQYLIPVEESVWRQRTCEGSFLCLSLTEAGRPERERDGWYPKIFQVGPSEDCVVPCFFRSPTDRHQQVSFLALFRRPDQGRLGGGEGRLFLGSFYR